MKLSDKILLIANWLTAQDNELLVEAETRPEMMETLALHLTSAASNLEEAAREVAVSETDGVLTEESLDEMAEIAEAFAASDDALLQKQANVLDQILFNLAVPQDYLANVKMAEDDKIAVLKKKYLAEKEKRAQEDGITDMVKAIKDSGVSQVHQNRSLLSFPLKTRYCPDHPGASTAHIGDGTFQCPLDHRTYNYEVGYTLLDNSKVPGGDISNQTPKLINDQIQMFDSRDQRLGIYR